MKRLGVAALALLCLGSTSASADTAALRIENDLFYKADREYTSGTGIGWTREPDADPWANRVARFLPLFPDGARVRANFAVEQTIFTPTDKTLINPVATDRPYAGWLHGTVQINSQSDERLSQYALQVGVVGPWALGEEAQNFVHAIRGFKLAKGWHYQLRNEPGLVLSTQQSWRFGFWQIRERLGFDFIPHAGAVVGNVYDYADAGFLVRVGRLTDDWSPARIEPTMPGTDIVDDDWGFYAFGGVEGRAVARNIFLDGNTFESSRSVSKYPFVGDAEIGMAVTLDRFRLAYTHVFRSREYRTQADNHQFGTIGISVRF